jgi:hypothetical protein
MKNEMAYDCTSTKAKWKAQIKEEYPEHVTRSSMKN